MNINVLIQIVILFITIYNNTIAQKDYYNNKESIKNRNYIIDNNINVMKCYYYDASNKITLKDSLLYCVYEYDSLGNQIHAVLYSTTEKNHIEEEYYYKFDKKIMKLKQIWFPILKNTIVVILMIVLKI